MTAVPNEPFSTVLRERTAAVHREAERTGFIADLIRNRADRAGYALYLRSLVPVYETMERALAAAAPDGGVLEPFADARLRRLAPLVADLVAIAGAGWDRLPLLPEADAYAGAVAAAAGSGGLVAHAYARYLGDLSGGQILKPLLARSLGLPPDALGFYDFPAFADVAEPKAAMRAALDRVPARDAEGVVAESIVAEAISAFRHTIALSLAVSRAAVAVAA